MREFAVGILRRAARADGTGLMNMRIQIDIARQTLELFSDDETCIRRYPVSTALNGAGECAGSECTPRGRHRIRAKIGHGAAMGAVFRGRRPTGEIWTPQLAAALPGRDWILSRILWLCGEERGRNRGGKVDSMKRYIYIHGTADDQPMGVPLSHGCIRMRDREVIELFDLVAVGTRVDIV
jgi:lipoprotein-anchoring transpeptidase ErfK/SrfK